MHDYSRRLYLANDIRQAVEIAESDRRYTVFRTSDKYEKLRVTDQAAHHAYFRALREQMAGDGLPAFVELMRRRKIDPDRLRDAYETAAKKAMQRGQAGPATRWIIDSVRLGEFSSAAYDPEATGTLSAVQLTGEGVVIKKHGGKDMVVLPQRAMRLHFQHILRQAPERWEAARSETLEALGDVLADLLGADAKPGSARIDGKVEKCWFVPHLNTIRATLLERGFLTAADVVEESSEDTKWRWETFGGDARAATDDALRHAAAIAEDATGRGLVKARHEAFEALHVALHLERQRMAAYEAHRDGGDAWDNLDAACRLVERL